jgi:radical SAM superfamily enzyme YgiQ (UPF0313 family)
LAKPVKIYLGDLTYDTVGLSTEVFPLNIGYIASYCKKIFDNNVEIKIFKYIEKLEKAINENPPDIIGLSNYAWCYQIGREIFKIALKKNPEIITVWGGPNFPLDMPSQEEFMKKHSEVDFYVPIDGETGFSNIVRKYLELNSKEMIREQIFDEPIEGCLSLNKTKILQYNNPVIRIKKLDEIPSPYVSGILDEFFDGRLSPMLQTNRGCPFSCTFCTDGSSLVQQVNQFSLDRVKDELEYIAKKTPKNIHSMNITDLNFGMFPRDIEVCKIIVDCQKKYDFPKIIQGSTGKNRKEKIIDAIKILNGSLRLGMSVQSLDEEVLKNIKRSNISVDKMLELAPVIREEGLSTTAEVILGLPGETYESHIQTLRKLVKYNLNYVRPYTLMLLNGAEMNTPEQRKKWGFKTKFRILPKDFVKLKNGKNVIESEEVVISTNTLSFEEYVNLRLLAFIMFVTNIGLVFDPITKFLREKNIDVFNLFYETLNRRETAPKTVLELLEKFEQSTKNELWNSSEEIHANYQKDAEFMKLLNGEDGINVLQHFQAMVIFENFEDWVEYTLNIAESLLVENDEFNLELKEEFYDLANYCRGLSFKTVSSDRHQFTPEYTFHYDIPKWLQDKNKDLRYFKESSIKLKFSFSKKQSRIVQDGLNLCGDTMVGKSRIFRWVPPNSIWRIASSV